MSRRRETHRSWIPNTEAAYKGVGGGKFTENTSDVNKMTHHRTHVRHWAPFSCGVRCMTIFFPAVSLIACSYGAATVAAPLAVLLSQTVPVIICWKFYTAEFPPFTRNGLSRENQKTVFFFFLRICYNQFIPKEKQNLRKELQGCRIRLFQMLVN